MRLDELTTSHIRVGYGEVGLRGSLGYENKSVTIRGRAYASAISTHPPARVAFGLDGRFSHFRCAVVINDDVPAGRSHADFFVLADGRRVAHAPHVLAGQPPLELVADVTGAQTLELVVETTRWEYCHAVWLDAEVSDAQAARPHGMLVDCLARAEITVPVMPPRANRCIATVISPGFETLADDMLGSLHAYGCCNDAMVVIFSIASGYTSNDAPERLARKYGAYLVRCRPIAHVSAQSKAILYSVARVIDADAFVCLDADMLILEDLRPVFEAVKACPNGTIFACREGNGFGYHNVEHALCTVYGGARGTSRDWSASVMVRAHTRWLSTTASSPAADPPCSRSMV